MLPKHPALLRFPVAVEREVATLSHSGAYNRHYVTTLRLRGQGSVLHVTGIADVISASQRSVHNPSRVPRQPHEEL